MKTLLSQRDDKNWPIRNKRFSTVENDTLSYTGTRLDDVWSWYLPKHFITSVYFTRCALSRHVVVCRGLSILFTADTATWLKNISFDPHIIENYYFLVMSY